MKRYLKIYKALLRINLISLFTYRANFINSTISSLVWGTFSVITIFLLTSRTNSVLGWSREELILLTAVFSIIVGIFHIFIARGFERFARIMAWGTFDSVLLKPIDSQFSVSFWELNYSAISRVILGFLMLAYLLHYYSYSIDPLFLIVFLMLLIAGVFSLYSLWLIGATFIIWFTQMSNIIDFMYTVNGFIRQPSEMYKKISGGLFLLVLPVVFVATSPLKSLIGKPNYYEIAILLLLNVTFLIVSRAFWRFGLRYYTSASN